MKLQTSLLAAVITAWISSPSVAQVGPFESDAKNRQAVGVVRAGSKVPAQNGIWTLASRVGALGALRERVGATEAPVDNVVPGQTKAPTFLTSFDDAGRLEGVWALRGGGLSPSLSVTEPRTAAHLDKMFRSFVRQNAALYDLQGSAAETGSEMDWLRTGELVQYTSPEGKIVRHLHYDQTVQGIPIKGGEIIASFVGADLISVNGALENPAGVEKFTPTAIPDARARAIAVDQDRSAYGGTSTATKTSLLWDRNRGIPVYRVSTLPSSETVAMRPSRYLIDAQSGSVLDRQDDSLGAAGPSTSLAEVSRNYKLYQPIWTDQYPFIRHEATHSWVGLKEIISGTTYYYHSDKGNGGATHPTFGYIYTGPGPNPVISPSNKSCLGVFGDFTSAYTVGNTSPFASQHTVRWAQYAAQMAAATTFKSLYKAAVTNQTMSVVVGTPGGSSFAYGDCTGWGLSGTDCIEIAPLAQPWVGASDVSALGVIYHEYGHIADGRMTYPDYRNNNHGCEPMSLEETIAGIFSTTVFLWQYGITATFTDYDGHGDPSLAPGVQGFFHGLGHGGAQNPWVHFNNPMPPALPGVNPGDIVCYDTRKNSCAPNQYNYGMGLVQAYWEAAHGTNCGAGCVTLSDGSSQAHARNALAYAMSTTTAASDFVTFSANFLTYYWTSVGDPPYTNRWWIFNHHRLVGPNYGYSPCHQW